MLVNSPKWCVCPRVADNHCKAGKLCGFSLIELLISLLIFSVGVLGLASIQITSMRMSQDAQQNYTASLLASALSSQISAQRSISNIDFWVTQVSESLPAGQTQIEQIPSGYRVRLEWRPSEDQSLQQANAKSEYVIDVIL